MNYITIKRYYIKDTKISVKYIIIEHYYIKDTKLFVFLFCKGSNDV
jgi:hypothetical protein